MGALHRTLREAGVVGGRQSQDGPAVQVSSLQTPRILRQKIAAVLVADYESEHAGLRRDVGQEEVRRPNDRL